MQARGGRFSLCLLLQALWPSAFVSSAGIYLRRIPSFSNREQPQSHRPSELIGTYRPQSHRPASCSSARAEPLRLRRVAELTGLSHRPSEPWGHTSLTKSLFHEALQAFLKRCKLYLHLEPQWEEPDKQQRADSVSEYTSHLTSIWEKGCWCPKSILGFVIC